MNENYVIEGVSFQKSDSGDLESERPSLMTAVVLPSEEIPPSTISVSVEGEGRGRDHYFNLDAQDILALAALLHQAYQRSDQNFQEIVDRHGLQEFIDQYGLEQVVTALEEGATSGPESHNSDKD